MKSSMPRRSRFERLLGRLLLPGFRRLYSLSWRFTRRYTPAGRGVVIGLVVTAVLGVDTDQVLIYQLFALLSVVMMLSWSMGSGNY